MSSQDIILIRDHLESKKIRIDHLTDDEVLAMWFDWSTELFAA